MEKEVIGHCPVCSNKLIATNLLCNNCKLQLVGDFNLSKFSYLEKEEQEFVLKFLASEGSYKAIQEDLGITYAKAKERLSVILQKLGLKILEVTGGEEIMSNDSFKGIEVKTEDHFVVRLIKAKLNEHGGKATIPLVTEGNDAIIKFDSEGRGLVCNKIPIPNQLTWEVFIAAYDILIMQDNDLYKGYARAGKLGSDRLPIDSLEGYIAYKVHGVKPGGSAFSPGFIIAAVLDWVGILENERGSTLKMSNEIIAIESYEEVVRNAVVFNKVLSKSDIIRERLNMFKHWYYFKDEDIFAPSKFIGYKEMNANTYEAFAIGSRDEMDGRDTVRTLENFFIETTGKERELLYAKLEHFLNEFGKAPNAICHIHVKK